MELNMKPNTIYKDIQNRNKTLYYKRDSSSQNIFSYLHPRSYPLLVIRRWSTCPYGEECAHMYMANKPNVHK